MRKYLSEWQLMEMLKYYDLPIKIFIIVSKKIIGHVT